jgi:hypothetical protein
VVLSDRLVRRSYGGPADTTTPLVALAWIVSFAVIADKPVRRIKQVVISMNLHRQAEEIARLAAGRVRAGYRGPRDPLRRSTGE